MRRRTAVLVRAARAKTDAPRYPRAQQPGIVQVLQGAWGDAWTPGPAVWIEVRPGTPPDTAPTIEEIAELVDAGREVWERFLDRYGLPGRGEGVRLALPDGREVVRIPLRALRQVAVGARDLEAHVMAVLTDTPATPGSKIIGRLLSKRVVARSLRGALAALVPVVNPLADTGITNDWSFVAQGWWPLAVLEELVHRDRVDRRCAAPGCLNPVPPGWRKYCSRRCYWRDNQRRHRAGKKVKKP